MKIKGKSLILFIIFIFCMSFFCVQGQIVMASEVQTLQSGEYSSCEISEKSSDLNVSTTIFSPVEQFESSQSSGAEAGDVDGFVSSWVYWLIIVVVALLVVALILL